MSTDWIKMRVDLRTHPKVVRMATALKADKLRVVGGLFAVWSIFDAHSSDGVLEGYTFESIDDELHWKGFAKAMAGIEWLVFDESQGEGLLAPRFEEHNGQSAKRRAMETERKRLEREAEKAAADAAKAATKAGQASAFDADKSVTRGREEGEGEKDSYSKDQGAELPVVTPAASVCRALRAAGIPGVSPSHPKLLALLQAGATASEFVEAAPKGVGKSGGFAYVLGVVEGRRRDAATSAKSLHVGPLPVSETTFQRSRREQVEQMTGGRVSAKPPAAVHAANSSETFDAIPPIALG